MPGSLWQTDPATGKRIRQPPRGYDAQYVRRHVRERVVAQDRGHETACWIWQGGINGCGYPTGRPAGCSHGLMHRKSYEAFVGPIPHGLVIDHVCRVRCCVNPDHLEPVTYSENNRRRYAREGKAAARENLRGEGLHTGSGQDVIARRHREPV